MQKRLVQTSSVKFALGHKISPSSVDELKNVCSHLKNLQNVSAKVAIFFSSSFTSCAT